MLVFHLDVLLMCSNTSCSQANKIDVLWTILWMHANTTSYTLVDADPTRKQKNCIHINLKRRSHRFPKSTMRTKNSRHQDFSARFDFKLIGSIAIAFVVVILAIAFAIFSSTTYQVALKGTLMWKATRLTLADLRQAPTRLSWTWYFYSPCSQQSPKRVFFCSCLACECSPGLPLRRLCQIGDWGLSHRDPTIVSPL